MSWQSSPLRASGIREPVDPAAAACKAAHLSPPQGSLLTQGGHDPSTRQIVIENRDCNAVCERPPTDAGSCSRPAVVCCQQVISTAPPSAGMTEPQTLAYHDSFLRHSMCLTAEELDDIMGSLRHEPMGQMSLNPAGTWGSSGSGDQGDQGGIISGYSRIEALHSRPSSRDRTSSSASSMPPPVKFFVRLPPQVQRRRLRMSARSAAAAGVVMVVVAAVASLTIGWQRCDCNQSTLLKAGRDTFLPDGVHHKAGVPGQAGVQTGWLSSGYYIPEERAKWSSGCRPGTCYPSGSSSFGLDGPSGRPGSATPFRSGPSRGTVPRAGPQFWINNCPHVCTTAQYGRVLASALAKLPATLESTAIEAGRRATPWAARAAAAVVRAAMAALRAAPIAAKMLLHTYWAAVRCMAACGSLVSLYLRSEVQAWASANSQRKLTSPCI